MQSHIDCICMTFLHCAFSNVASNCLPDVRHSYIGYICLTFLRCAFSHGSCLPARGGAIKAICSIVIVCCTLLKWLLQNELFFSWTFGLYG